MFKLDGVDLELTNDAMNSIAPKAKALKTNARGIKSIMEDILLQWQYKSTSLVKKGLTGINNPQGLCSRVRKGIIIIQEGREWQKGLKLAQWQTLEMANMD